MENTESLVGYYINLDTRKDRREHFEENVKCNTFFSNVERMSAIYHNVKGAGCTLSHIECLRRIKKSINDADDASLLPKYYVIREDEFESLEMDNFNEFVESFKNIKESDHWDVILLTPRGEKIENDCLFMNLNGYYRINKSQTTTGYILKPHMIDILLENYINSYIELLNNRNYMECALDQSWKKVQLTHNFYFYRKIYGGQLPGWSDLENTYVKYNYGYLIQ